MDEKTQINENNNYSNPKKNGEPDFRTRIMSFFLIMGVLTGIGFYRTTSDFKFLLLSLICGLTLLYRWESFVKKAIASIIPPTSKTIPIKKTNQIQGLLKSSNPNTKATMPPAISPINSSPILSNQIHFTKTFIYLIYTLMLLAVGLWAYLTTKILVFLPLPFIALGAVIFYLYRLFKRPSTPNPQIITPAIKTIHPKNPNPSSPADKPTNAKTSPTTTATMSSSAIIRYSTAKPLMNIAHSEGSVPARSAPLGSLAPMQTKPMEALRLKLQLRRKVQYGFSTQYWARQSGICPICDIEVFGRKRSQIVLENWRRWLC